MSCMRDKRHSSGEWYVCVERICRGTQRVVSTRKRGSNIPPFRPRTRSMRDSHEVCHSIQKRLSEASVQHSLQTLPTALHSLSTSLELSDCEVAAFANMLLVRAPADGDVVIVKNMVCTIVPGIHFALLKQHYMK